MIVRAKKPDRKHRSDDTPAAKPVNRSDDTTDLLQRKSAIVTARRPGKARMPDGWLPDTEEEHQRRGDAADAMFQEMKRAIAEKLRKP